MTNPASADRGARAAVRRAGLAAALLLAACTPSSSPVPSIPAATPLPSASQVATPAPTPQPSAAPTPSPTVGPTAPPSSTPAPPTGAPSTPASPAPSDGLGGFPICSLPFQRSGTSYPTHLVQAVRVGTHTGYDRIVFEFQGAGLPELELQAASPPFTLDPSDLPVTVQGTTFFTIALRGAAGHDLNGQTVYPGPDVFRPGYPGLTELRMLGDWEAVMSWVVGRPSATCLRVLTLSSPTRLVIDLAHP